MKNIYLILTLILLIVSCNNSSKKDLLLGKWKGSKSYATNPNEFPFMELTSAGGKINMINTKTGKVDSDTSIYYTKITSWKLSKDTLILNTTVNTINGDKPNRIKMLIDSLQENQFKSIILIPFKGKELPITIEKYSRVN